MEFKAMRDSLKSRLSHGFHLAVGALMVVMLAAVAYWVFFGAVGRTSLVRFLPAVQGMPWLCLEGSREDLEFFRTFGPLLAPLGGGVVPFSDQKVEHFALVRELSPLGGMSFAARLSAGDEDLRSGRVPEGLLIQGYVAKDMSGQGVFSISSPDGGEVGFMAYREGTLLFSSRMEGLNAMLELSSKASEGGKPLLRGWDLEPSWDGHLAFGDGGRYAEMTSSEGQEEARAFVAFRRKAPDGQGQFEPVGEAKWRLDGLELPLLDSMDRSDWSGLQFRVASPVALALGFKVRSGQFDKVPFTEPISRWLDLLGLSAEGKDAIVSSPAALSFGGRTEVLWLSMPGALLSFPSSGKAGEELAKSFWSKVLLGAAPQPMSGYQSGGYTNLPFSMVVASNGDEVELGLISPGSIGNARDNLPEGVFGSNMGWLYANLPALSDAVGDVMGILNFLGLDDGNPFVEKAQGDVKDALSAMSPVLLIFNDARSGRMEWYNPPKR